MHCMRFQSGTHAERWTSYGDEGFYEEESIFDKSGLNLNTINLYPRGITCKWHALSSTMTIAIVESHLFATPAMCGE